MMQFVKADTQLPIVTMVDNLMVQAIKDRASDVHIEPLPDNVRVRVRVDGVLREIATWPIHTHAPLISRLKVLADMDIAEKRLPQDGHIQQTIHDVAVDIRVSCIPTIRGEKIVLRILRKDNTALSLDSLAFSQDVLDRLSNLYKYSYGMILATGPTGSGKTTTLYSILSELNYDDKNIITIEDPVEYNIAGISQLQVNKRSGFTFSAGLRAVLRQDPDVIMVGEIRDKETADIAVRAALTGHLVLSTLHTNDAAGALVRLVDMQVEQFLVASSVRAIIAQRLVRRLCPHCLTGHDILSGSLEDLFLQDHNEARSGFKHSTGCPECNFTGYHGRLAICEMLQVTPQIRLALMQRCAAEEILRLAVGEGFINMRADGIAKARQGLTDISEIIRVAYTDA